MFYVETQMGRKPQNVFSYMSWRITFIGSTNFLCFPAATGRRLQPPSFSGYNLREAPTPQISGYNQKEATTPNVLQLQREGGSNPLVYQATTWGKLQLLNSLATTRRRLQPPMFSDYNRKVATTTCPCPVQPPWSRSRMMEPLSHHHCEIYHYKHVPINMNHASTCTSTCNQPIP